MGTIEEIYTGDAVSGVAGTIMFRHRRSKICDACKRPIGAQKKTILLNEIEYR